MDFPRTFNSLSEMRLERREFYPPTFPAPNRDISSIAGRPKLDFLTYIIGDNKQIPSINIFSTSVASDTVFATYQSVVLLPYILRWR